MGVYGWTEVADNVVLVGRVRSHGYSKADGDWDIVVEPAAGFQQLLVNPAGESNANGALTCEIEPTEKVVHDLAKGRDRAAVEAEFFADLVGRDVTVVGTHAVDRSHFANGKTPGRPATKRGKMEIHPITSIFVETSAPGATIKRVEFFVFANDSRRRLLPVPHNLESRVASFQTTFPTAGNGDFRRFNVIDEINHAANTNREVVIQPNGAHALRCTVNSGSPKDNRGFYHAVFELFRSTT